MTVEAQPQIWSGMPGLVQQNLIQDCYVKKCQNETQPLILRDGKSTKLTNFHWQNRKKMSWKEEKKYLINRIKIIIRLLRGLTN